MKNRVLDTYNSGDSKSVIYNQVTEENENNYSSKSDSGCVPHKPSWSDMSINYPDTSILTIDLYTSIGGQFPKYNSQTDLLNGPYANSCAFRMSRGLNLSNRKLPPKDNKNQLVLKGGDKLNYWGRVRELYPILKKMCCKPDWEKVLKKAGIGEEKEKLTSSDWDFLNNNKGIIMFEVSGWGDASGHFTLWDGAHLAYPGNPEHDDPNSDYYYFNMKYESNSKVIQTDKIVLWVLA